MELLAKKFATAPVDPIEMAEFMRLLQNERSLKRLKALLSLNYVDCTGPVLARIAEIIPGDSKLYLSLALWNYHLGCDDQAFALLEKARKINHSDPDNFRADIWFSFSRGAEEIHKKCKQLLERFPNDAWAMDVCQTLEKNGKILTLRTPEWDNQWENLIRAGTGVPGEA
jgi:tetratricopeptide (TPR) repeat protein